MISQEEWFDNINNQFQDLYILWNLGGNDYFSDSGINQKAWNTISIWSTGPNSNQNKMTFPNLYTLSRDLYNESFNEINRYFKRKKCNWILFSYKNTLYEYDYYKELHRNIRDNFIKIIFYRFVDIINLNLLERYNMT